MDVRGKLVELIGSTEYGNGSLVGNNFQKGFIENIATHLIANGVTVKEWISVDDMLPDENGRYLAVKERIAPDKLGGNRTDIVILRFFVDDGFKIPTHIPDWINKEINEEVTHWMPIPKPPERE